MSPEESTAYPTFPGRGVAETKAGSSSLSGALGTAKFPGVGLSHSKPSFGPGISEELGIPQVKAMQAL